jgi:hypothetical protein
MGPQTGWIGYINNLRIFPFTDGHNSDSFSIKYIKISSLATYSCTNTQCSYYSCYSHPCPGGGSKGYCETAVSAYY